MGRSRKRPSIDGLWHQLRLREPEGVACDGRSVERHIARVFDRTRVRRADNVGRGLNGAI